MSATTENFPQEFGQRLLPSLVDALAVSDPERPFVSISHPGNTKDGFKDINIKDFARAVNRASWWLRETLGDAGPGFPTMTYMGPQDIRYPTLMLAASKTGYTLFLPSPRNSLQAHLALLEDQNCKILLVPQDAPPLEHLAQLLLSHRTMQRPNFPSASWFLREGTVAAYPYDKTFDEAKDDPFVTLHTSGTTGMPKAFLTRHCAIVVADSLQKIPHLGGNPHLFDCWKGGRILLGFPLFHAGGITVLLCAIYFGYTVVLPPPGPISAGIIDMIHEEGHLTVSLIPPAILVELADNASSLENLGRLKHVMTGGGPLDNTIGNIISTRTHLSCCFGSTETTIVAHELLQPEDWQYFKFSPFFGYEMRKYDEELYELVNVRRDELKDFQAVFKSCPEIEDEWRLRDLFSKHPTKEDLWMFKGRCDDIVVYSTGQKFNPITMEDTISAHPAIVSVLVYGEGRFQSALLIQPKTILPSRDDKSKFLDDIWSIIQLANEECPTFAKIEKDFVIFTTPERPFPRAGKGTVQRRAALTMYKQELNAIYADGEKNSLAEQPSLGFWERESLLQSLLRIVQNIPGLESASTTSNLFDLGLDSLQVITITRQTRSLLVGAGKSPNLIQNRTVYGNPSIEKIVNVLLESGNLHQGVSSTTESIELKLKELYERYSSNLPITSRPGRSIVSTETVLLTGSTGSLGSYLLECLIQDRRVTMIYCLNRGNDSEQRQRISNAGKLLTTSFNSKKVRFLQADLSKSHLGLHLETYEELLRSVTRIVHNAWQVDFNVTLDHLASTHLQGVVQLTEFSSRSLHGALVFFLSSIGAVSNTYGLSQGPPIPEIAFEDSSTPQSIGYAQSKFLAERILSKAKAVANIPSAVCRIGQIAGPTTAAGVWPKQEWLPSIIASSVHLGNLPDSLGPLSTIDWIPVNKLAAAVVELLFNTTGSETVMPVYHAVNPHVTTWDKLLPITKASLNVNAVSFSAWVDILKQSAGDRNEINVATRNPALKLLEFFEELKRQQSAGWVQPTLETVHSVNKSNIIASLDPVSPMLMELWLRQWDIEEDL